MRKHSKETYDQVLEIWKQMSLNSYDDMQTILSSLNKRFNNLRRNRKSNIKSETMREILILTAKFSESDTDKKPRTYYYKLSIHWVLHHNFYSNPKFPCVKDSCYHRKDKKKVESENIYFAERLQRLNRHWRLAEDSFKKNNIAGNFSDYLKKY